jgi:hypothetical protein
MVAVLHLDPIRRPASAIGPISAFRYQALQPHVAGRPKQVWTDLALFKRRDKNAVGPPCQQPREVRLPHRERKRAHVVAVTGEHIEGVKLDLLVVLAGMQRVEIRDAIDAKDDGLTVDDELLHPVLQRGLDDPRVTLGPIVAIPSYQPHPVAVAMNEQPISIISQLVNPIRTRRTLVARVGMQGWNTNLLMEQR